MTEQPTPSVTDSDVERIARRDFPAGILAEVLAMLGEYGTETWQREAARVRLAVLKLAAGNIERLRSEIETAKCDYRDVLAMAEYPGYIRRGVIELSMEERQRVIDADWEQYQAWLTR
jgi:hypothetical protein